MWDNSVFSKSFSCHGSDFLAVWGSWAGQNTRCGFINVYAPQDISRKKKLWDNISGLVCSNPEVKWVIFGDFNEVRLQEETKVIFSLL